MTQAPDDLDFDINIVSSWFQREQETPFVLIRINEDEIPQWENCLSTTFRRCYVTDNMLLSQAKRLDKSIDELIPAKLPDPGSTMSGDFGEILAYLFQSCDALPIKAVGPKKWRLKQDRNKPAPYSDIVHFVLPEWPNSSSDDKLFCAEVKTKATNTTFEPIKDAIEGCEKDRRSRLADTLVWLRDRLYFDDLGDVGLDEINRFLKPDEHPPFKKEHRAIAIICSSLLEEELDAAPAEEPKNYSVIVIAVPNLKDTYSSVYQSIVNSPVLTEETAGSQ